MKDIRIISFFTPKYQQFGERLIERCNELAIDHRIVAISEQGHWWEHLKQKVDFLSDAWRPNKPQLWIDVDASLRHVEKLPDLKGVDIMALPRYDHKGGGKFRRPWRDASVLINTSQMAKTFCERLGANNKLSGHPLHTVEYVFDLTYRELSGQVNVQSLPHTFGALSCYKVEDPAIQHELTGNANILNAQFPNAKKVKANWARMPAPGNFGDILTHFMIARETQREPEFKYPSGHDVIMGAGSTIRLAEGCTVWGSGLMFERDRLHTANNIVAVRGPITRERLKMLDIPMGDPGLILPLFYNRSMEKRYAIGVIPHYVDHKAASAIFQGVDDVKVINILRVDIREVIDEVRSCDMIISSSLHGLIVAEAYGIPYGRVTFGGKLDGDGTKFKDFLISLPRSYSLKDEEVVFFANLSDIAKVRFHDPCWDESLGMELWKCAPFKLCNLL